MSEKYTQHGQNGVHAITNVKKAENVSAQTTTQPNAQKLKITVSIHILRNVATKNATVSI